MTARRPPQFPFALIVVSLWLPMTTFGSDSVVLRRLFEESTLESNHLDLEERLDSSRVPAQFQQLVNWVLPQFPSDDQRGFRVGGSIGRLTERDTVPEVTGRVRRSIAEYPEAAWIHAPVLDLVRVAKRVGRLDELRELVERMDASDDRESQRKEATLTLIAIAAEEIDVISERLDERFSSARSRQSEDAQEQHWLDLLVLWFAYENPVTESLVRNEYFGAYPQWGYSQDRQLDLIYDYLRLLHRHCAFRDHSSFHDQPRFHDQPGDSTKQSLDQQWFWFSRADNGTHARGRPLTRFAQTEKNAYKLSGHELDYLMLKTPIADDLDASVEFASRPYAFTELIMHGVGVSPSGNGQRAVVGGFAKGNQEIAIDPPLQKHGSKSQWHLRVKDGSVSHRFNGRLLRSSSSADKEKVLSSAPWLALRNWRRNQSEIQSVRLASSQSAVPVIDLLRDERLSGWASYHDPELENGLGTWRALRSASDEWLIRSVKADETDGCYHEDLLRYVVPICWNATIEYEFFYDASDCIVHPVVGRRVIVLDNAQIQVHRLTDGRFNAGSLRPDEVLPIAAFGGAESESYRLRPGWNRAQVRFGEDVVELSINQITAATLPLDPADSRIFGLFHYRDQSNAIVRNIRLSGDWPGEIPSISTQVLADKTIAELDRTARLLPLRLGHDFREGVPAEIFSVAGDEGSWQQLDDGIRITRKHGGGIDSLGVSAQVDGDFDIVVGYRDLAIPSEKVTWHCGFGLEVQLENLTRDISAVHRRRDRMHGEHCVVFGHQEINPGGQFGWTGGKSFVDESVSGKLRLARRENTIYALHATADSKWFRIVNQRELPPGPTTVSGIKLVGRVPRGMETSVTWTDLSIQAEGYDPLTVPNQRVAIATLEENRQSMPGETFDMTGTTFAEAGFTASTNGPNEFVTTSQGLISTVRATDRSRKLVLLKSQRYDQDFDVQVDFDLLRIDGAKGNGIGGETTLQVLLTDPFETASKEHPLRITEASLIFRNKWTGQFDLRPRVVGRGRGNKVIYLPIRTLFPAMLDQLRIAKKGRTLYFIVSEKGSDESRVIATYPLPSEVSMAWISLWSIAGPGGVTQTRWKQISIHGGTGFQNVIGQ